VRSPLFYFTPSTTHLHRPFPVSSPFIRISVRNRWVPSRASGPPPYLPPPINFFLRLPLIQDFCFSRSRTFGGCSSLFPILLSCLRQCCPTRPPDLSPHAAFCFWTRMVIPGFGATFAATLFLSISLYHEEARPLLALLSPPAASSLGSSHRLSRIVLLNFSSHSSGRPSFALSMQEPFLPPFPY